MRYLQLFIAKAVLVWTECTLAYSCKDGTPRREKMCYVDYTVEEMWCDDSNLSRIPRPSQVTAYMNPADSVRLYFNSTCLDNLQSDLKPYKRLKLVNLDGNKLKSIGAQSFSTCTTLVTLILSSNQISHINENAFDGLTHLEDLSLSHNKLTRISATLFTELGNLKTLNLASNLIEVVETDAFNGLAKLQSLDLSGNKIRSIDWGYGTVFQNLRTLNLQGNQLQSFNGGELRVFTSLTTINLQGNNISCITGSENFKLRGLESVQLSQNQLANLAADWFRSVLKHGREPDAASYVNGNLWNCDCSSYSYWGMLKDAKITEKWKAALDVECHSPAEYRGQKLSSLSHTEFEFCKSTEENKNCSTSSTTAKPLTTTTQSSTTTITATSKTATAKLVGPVVGAAMVENPMVRMKIGNKPTVTVIKEKPTKSTLIKTEILIVLVCLIIGMICCVIIVCRVKKCRMNNRAISDEEKQNPPLSQGPGNRDDKIEQTTAKTPLTNDSPQNQNNHVYSDIESNPNSNPCPNRQRNDSGCWSNHEEERQSFISELPDIQEGVFDDCVTVPKQPHVKQEGYSSKTPQMNSYVKVESSHPVKFVMEVPQSTCQHCGNCNK